MRNWTPFGAQRVSTFIESYWHSPAYLNRMKDENHPLMVDWMHVSIHIKKNFYEYQLSLIHMKEFPIVCIHDLWILHHWSKEIFINIFMMSTIFVLFFRFIEQWKNQTHIHLLLTLNVISLENNLFFFIQQSFAETRMEHML